MFRMFSGVFLCNSRVSVLSCHSVNVYVAYDLLAGKSARGLVGNAGNESSATTPERTGATKAGQGSGMAWEGRIGGTKYGHFRLCTIMWKSSKVIHVYLFQV